MTRANSNSHIENVARVVNDERSRSSIAIINTLGGKDAYAKYVALGTNDDRLCCAGISALSAVSSNAHRPHDWKSGKGYDWAVLRAA